MRSKVMFGGLAVVLGFLVATNPVVVSAVGQVTSGEIRNNTIKSKDIKNNQITGRDVRDGSLDSGDIADGSLRASDFAAGELPSTRAFRVAAEGPIAVGTGSPVTVATLPLAQAGTYVVTAKVYLSTLAAAADTFVECVLSDGAVMDTTSVGLDDGGGEDDHRTIGALMATTTAGPGAVTFTCKRFAGAAVTAKDISIVAIKVNGLN